MDITYRWTGKGMAQLGFAVEALGSAKAQRVYARALNRTGERVFTVVKRTLSTQVGLTQSVLVQRGALRLHRANAAALAARITSSGAHLPLRLFAARQVRKGVSHKAWGRREMNRSAFMVASLAGNVFNRTGTFAKMQSGMFAGQVREKIHKQWGPAIPKEMVKDASAKAFHDISASELPKRVAHELSRVTGGAVT